MRTQIELRFYFGAESLPPLFRSAMVRAASRLCGGCFVADGSGYWINRDDARGNGSDFGGTVETEETLCIGLTCEPEKVARVMRDMESATVDACDATGAAVDWVHVQETEITGRHFSVNAARAARAVAA